jgi:hypothetical protein
MNRRDIQKLLGGYATGTLTDAERELLFQAAAEDQEIFNALIAEEPLREALADPAARARLLAALDEPAPAARAMRWMWGHAVGVAAVGCFLAVGGYVAWQARHSQPPKVVYVAEMKPFSIDVPSEPEGKPAKATRAFDTSSINKAQPVKAKMPPLPAAPPLPPARPIRETPTLAAVTQPQPVQFPRAGPAPVAEASPVERVLITGQLSTLQAPVSAVNSFVERGNERQLSARALGGSAGNNPALARNDMRFKADAPQSPRALFYAAQSGQEVTVSAAAARLEAPAQNVTEQVTIATGNPYPSEGYIRPAIQFSVLRRTASGNFERIDGTEVAAGDVLRLSLEANRTGAVAVVLDGLQQPWLATTLRRQSPVLTTPMSFPRAGLHRVQIRFSTNTRADAVTLDDSVPQSQAETNASERATYVVATPGEPLTYSFTLRWK